MITDPKAKEARDRIWDEWREELFNSRGPRTREEWRDFTVDLFKDAAAVTSALDELATERAGLFRELRRLHKIEEALQSLGLCPCNEGKLVRKDHEVTICTACLRETPTFRGVAADATPRPHEDEWPALKDLPACAPSGCMGCALCRGPR